jgi:hypothetical protein
MDVEDSAKKSDYFDLDVSISAISCFLWLFLEFDHSASAESRKPKVPLTGRSD